MRCKKYIGLYETKTETYTNITPRIISDELFEKAGRFIIEKEKASIGNLQRVFRIGFNRAARIMDQLADYGVVGADEGTKAREILMTMEAFEELLRQLGK